MEKMLTREAKVQLASSLRRRYQAASSTAKKQILGEFVVNRRAIRTTVRRATLTRVIQLFEGPRVSDFI